MDWDAAIEKNREALKRVLAMAGLGQSAIADRQSGSAQAAEGPTDCLWPTADCRVLLPRHLHRAVLRLLRPAEAAARRLIIVAARAVAVAHVPKPIPAKVAMFAPSPSALRADTSPPLREGEDGSQARRPSSPPGTGGEVPSECEAERGIGETYARPPLVRRKVANSPRLSFPLFDPLRRFHRRRPARRGVPRISFPGFSDPFPIPPPPSDNDAIDATRLALRLAALARVLDDLPREARRFARWRARLDQGLDRRAEAASCGSEERAGEAARPGKVGANCRIRRLSPLRGGPPPGLPRRPSHAVHDILDAVHGLAFWVLERPDTS